MDYGWIKLYRKLLDNPISRRPHYLSLWVHLLLMATHKEHSFIWNNKKIIIAPGQVLTGRTALKNQTGIASSTIEKILNFFEKEQQIEQQKTTKWRLITIIKWEESQKKDSKSNNNEDNRGTTEEQQRGHIQGVFRSCVVRGQFV